MVDEDDNDDDADDDVDDDNDDVDAVDVFGRFDVDLLVSGTVLFAAVISGFSPTRTLQAGFDHVKKLGPTLKMKKETKWAKQKKN